ncbi:alpha-2-macroglobulin family protein [Fulvivirgaceae bacterium BMA10]|uniref:Alpha-2-macroglobulin family protein n=1 Tax=Splendidivirga corallicola TaxID=3051826 RepID=A0ABT8KTQ1_9BACT|nr:alpha-2-macroglobulin family protein [Fulvivirgaceae bacterium BMA10]
MKKLTIYFLTISTFLVISGFFLLRENKSVARDHFEGPLYQNDYKELWKQVDSLSSKELPESALKIVDRIYELAKRESNQAQIVKAIIHQMKFRSYKEEKSLVASIHLLKKEIEQSSYPAKALLQSMLAELHWQFYQRNRYVFLNRSESLDEGEDIQTWSINKLIKETTQLYKASLSQRDQLKHFSIDHYKVLLGGDSTSRYLRPTLFDLIANRALTFYASEEATLTNAQDQFTINNPGYLADYKTFTSFSIKSSDTNSLKYNALLLYQDLMNFHLNDKEPDALIDVDLQRLSMVRMNSTIENSDTRYFEALEKGHNAFNEHTGSTNYQFAMANYLIETANKYEPLKSEAHQWDLKKAFEVCENAITRFPGSFGAKNCEQLKNNILRKHLDLKFEEVNLPDQPLRSLVTYKNINTIHLKLVKLNPLETDSLSRWRIHNNKEKEKILSLLRRKNALKIWEQSLPDDKDYQSHKTEIKIPALSIGSYAILVANNKEFEKSPETLLNYTLFRVSNLNFVARSRNGLTEFYVTDRHSGKPLKDISTSFYHQKYNSRTRTYSSRLVSEKRTDENGYVKFKSSRSDRNYLVWFVNRHDSLRFNHYYDYWGNDRERSQTQTYFFTDRGIYRPGQTIYFKGMVVRKQDRDVTPLAGQKMKVRFLDTNWEEIATETFVTNEFGTFQGSFTAPVGKLNGKMHLQTDHGSVSFSVEEYKRPTFEVKFDSLKVTPQLNDHVTISGSATSYSGANIDQADVRYRVVRNVYLPYFGYRSWTVPSFARDVEIKQGRLKTNVDGSFELDFPALPDLTANRQDKPVFTFTIYVDVTDLNGETRSNTMNVNLSYETFKITATIAENVPKEGTNKFELHSANIQDVFIPLSGEIVVYQLKQPNRIFRKRLWERPDRFTMTEGTYYKEFPYDVYDDEDQPSSWEKGAIVFRENFDTGKKRHFEIDNLKKWKDGAYFIRIKAENDQGQSSSFEHYFNVFAQKKTGVPISMENWLTILKDNGEPGEKALFRVGTGADYSSVLYEIEHNGKILKSCWEETGKKQKQIEVPITEDFRGNFVVHFMMMQHSRVYHKTVIVKVPRTDKKLEIETITFRNKLEPGGKEEWRFKIKGPDQNKVLSEMVATLYDASLDTFQPLSWPAVFQGTYYPKVSWGTDYRWNRLANARPFPGNQINFPHVQFRTYEELNWFGYYQGRNYLRRVRLVNQGNQELNEIVGSTFGVEAAKEELALEEKVLVLDSEESEVEGDLDGQEKPSLQNQQSAPLAPVIRTNFNETAFFYPQLKTDENGEIAISFTVPESLTRWRLLGFAHTKDLKHGSIEKETITQKELMISANAPRFFREGDQIVFTAKLFNLANGSINGEAELQLFNALNMHPLNATMIKGTNKQSFQVSKDQSTVVKWSLVIPEGINAVTYRVSAKAGNFTDGEEMTIPLLTNRMLVTESLPLSIRRSGKKTYTFDKLLQAGKSPTLKNERLTVEISTNPAWYAVQALPYMMEYPYECAEQVFSRYYANSIASHVAHANPGIKQIFDQWKSQTKGNKDALLSNLVKNQELKSVLLEESPWVMQAKDEGERKKRLALLFDLNRMENEQQRAMDKLLELQLGNGGFPWFAGMRDNRYITQHIVAGFGHLQQLGVERNRINSDVQNTIRQAVNYLDARMYEAYLHQNDNPGLKQRHISHIESHYLYARSFFKEFPLLDKHQEALNHFLKLAKKSWVGQGVYQQAMLALALHRWEDKKTPASILKSLKERAIVSEELGTYWKSNNGGYYWYQAPIETQALLIELFTELEENQELIEGMKIWLLKQKQTQDWKTTKATAEACYALLLQGTDLLGQSSDIKLKLGNVEFDPQNTQSQEAGTGYVKKSWAPSEFSNDMGKIEVVQSKDQLAWGAVYWQYFEQLDKITPATTPLKLKKQLFLSKNTPDGPVIEAIDENKKLKPGDLIKVRVELRSDRTMEFIHLKDMRASCFEPVNVLSGYRYQDGLGYYQSTKDASMNFFIAHLPKGTYVLEYDLRVTHEGDFSNGITTVQSMYAPEFASHSEGNRVMVN